MSINILFTIAVVLLVSSPKAQAQGRPANPESSFRPYAVAVGLVGNPQALGAQAEARFLKSFGVRLAGTRLFNYQRQNEFGGGGIGLLTYYIPLNNKRIEPVLGLGGVYALYHWDTGYNSGNLNDVNVGGGVGLNLRFSQDFRLGLNLLAANSFEAGYVDGAMRAVRRKLLFLPLLSFDVLL